jgi:hypothetical protein
MFGFSERYHLSWKDKTKVLSSHDDNEWTDSILSGTKQMSEVSFWKLPLNLQFTSAKKN